MDKCGHTSGQVSQAGRSCSLMNRYESTPLFCSPCHGCITTEYETTCRCETHFSSCLNGAASPAKANHRPVFSFFFNSVLGPFVSWVLEETQAEVLKVRAVLSRCTLTIFSLQLCHRLFFNPSCSLVEIKIHSADLILRDTPSDWVGAALHTHVIRIIEVTVRPPLSAPSL